MCTHANKPKLTSIQSSSSTQHKQQEGQQDPSYLGQLPQAPRYSLLVPLNVVRHPPDAVQFGRPRPVEHRQQLRQLHNGAGVLVHQVGGLLGGQVCAGRGALATQGRVQACLLGSRSRCAGGGRHAQFSLRGSVQVPASDLVSDKREVSWPTIGCFRTSCLKVLFLVLILGVWPIF